MSKQSTVQTPLSESPDLPTKLPPGYSDKHHTVVCILKDLPSRFSASNAEYDPLLPPPDIPKDEVSHGYSHLTGEGLSTNRYAKSRRIVERKLRTVRNCDYRMYSVIASTFLQVDSGHGDYEYARVRANEGTPKERAAFKELQRALMMLTGLCLDYTLFARHPAFTDSTKTLRKQTMEESYRELYRVFDSWCQQLKPTNKTYRNKAINNTVTKTGQCKTTIQRAIHFMESGKLGHDPHDSATTTKYNYKRAVTA